MGTFDLQYPDNLLARVFQLLKDDTPQFFKTLSPGYEKRLDEALKALPEQERTALIRHYKDRFSFTIMGGVSHGICTQGIRKLQRPYIKNLICGNLANNSAATIECLDLSNRTYNCLKRAGCSLVDDVLRALPRWNDKAEMVCSDKLLRTHNIGADTYAEIIDELHRKGLLKSEEYNLMKAAIENEK